MAKLQRESDSASNVQLRLRQPSEISVMSLSDASYSGLEGRGSLIPKCVGHRIWVDPSTVKYYLPKCDRFVHVADTIWRHWLPRDRPNNMNVMNDAFRDGIEWVLVEPWMVQDNAVRRLALGDLFNKTAQFGGLSSIIACFVFPDRRWMYWPFTSASILGALAYGIFCFRDPIRKYQVVKSPLHLTKFSIYSYRYELTVFRKTGNNRRIARCSVALLALLHSVYFVLYPPRPSPSFTDCVLTILKFLKDLV